jgi:hypothetical protein
MPTHKLVLHIVTAVDAVQRSQNPARQEKSEVSAVMRDTYRGCFEQGELSRKKVLRGTTAVEKNSSVALTLF